MAVVIRLTRVGARNAPCYRVVVTDKKTPRDGRFIENLGTYNPRLETPVLGLDLEKLDQWVAKGARMSDTVRSLVRRERKRREATVDATEEPVAATAAVETDDAPPPPTDDASPADEGA